MEKVLKREDKKETVVEQSPKKIPPLEEDVEEGLEGEEWEETKLDKKLKKMSKIVANEVRE
jgi:hypothetical protein